MNNKSIVNPSDIGKIFFAALFYRVVAVILVVFTLPIRPTLPLWMLEWFLRASYPLLVYSFLSLIFYKKVTVWLQKYPLILYLDLLIAVGIIQIGGSWRSSYFGYTITAIIFFTIFKGRAGAYVSSLILTLASIIKDPSGGLPSFEIFFVDDFDMRMGAALIYVTAGLILGYFSTLLQRLEKLSLLEIEKTRQLSAMEEKTKLALELHDGAKQMANALRLKMEPLVGKANTLPKEAADELRWFWRGINYLHGELKQVVDTLKTGKDESPLGCCAKNLAEEEARIVKSMTGFSWQVAAESETMPVPSRSQTPLRRFLGEALINAWKHSGVMSGRIELSKVSGGISIIIMDSGKGFLFSGTPQAPTTGLQSLSHRAKELNAEWTIDTAPEQGCKITLILPGGDRLPNSQK